MENNHYIIRGGVPGRERLRLLARVMQPTTLALLARAGLQAGMECLDVGCGGGDVSFELARHAGPSGRVVAVDIDAVKIELARAEAAAQQVGTIEFRVANISDGAAEPIFDLVYARFLLTHLADPAEAVARMQQFLRPGGVVVVEDIDFTGHFCHPDCPAFWRYVDLYTRSVQRRGGDPNIGPRLPRLLIDAGCEHVQMNVVQPAGMEGEVKLTCAITMESIADAVLAEGLASQAEVEATVAALYAFARETRTIVSLPRVVQAWGYRTAS
jgi:SAM-dependent methyltransferase